MIMESDVTSTSVVLLTVPFVPTGKDDNQTQQRGLSAVETFTQALGVAQEAAPNSEILVVLEQKIKNERATEGIEGVLKNQPHCTVVSCDEFETVGRWYRGLRIAFSDEATDKVLVIPGDIEKVENPSVFAEALKRMLAERSPSLLSVGDYTSTDKFKEEFDPRFAHPLLEMAFPAEWQIIKAEGIRKVRSEYFCVGREVFAAFLRQGWRWLPLDATFLLMLAAASPSEQGLGIRKIDLGLVTDTPTRNVESAVEQVVRFAFQTWFNSHVRDQDRDKDERKQLQRKLLAEFSCITNKAMAVLLTFVQD